MIEAEILFFTCYGAMTFWALMGCLYLLLRRNNVFATDITSSLRLRRWMAASCASVAVSHVWWMLLYYGQADGSDPAGRILLCRVLDVLFNLSVIFYTMLVMLQDRRRPLWYAVVYDALGLAILLSEYLLGPQASWLSILLSVVMVLYVNITLVVGVRQYGRWLRDNYADLEHKEVWQTYLVMLAFLPSIFFYSFFNVDRVFDILLEVVNIPLFFILLWRVETLQDLEESVEEPFEDGADKYQVVDSEGNTKDKQAYSTYAELGTYYDFLHDHRISLALGAAFNKSCYNGYDKNFSICNVELKYTYNLAIKDFTLPLSAMFIYNPVYNKAHVNFTASFAF